MPVYLVTGAAGFIGSHLCERLLEGGDEVLGIDRFSSYYGREDKEENLQSLKGKGGFRFRELDLRTAPLEEIASQVNGVFHLAAQAGVRESWGSAFEEYVGDNVLATQCLLEAFRDRPLRGFVYASSSSVYGDAETAPTVEDTIPCPVSPYGMTKLAGEHLCTLYNRNYGVPTVMLRYFTVFGPRQRPDMAFHRFLKAGLREEPISLYGDGSQSRDFTYVGDAADATAAAMEKGERGCVYNIGGGERATVNDVIASIEKILEKPLKINSEPVQKGDVRHTWADTRRAAAAIGFQPATRLEDGLRLERDWLLRREEG